MRDRILHTVLAHDADWTIVSAKSVEQRVRELIRKCVEFPERPASGTVDQTDLICESTRRVGKYFACGRYFLV
jgi:hypothetical protein